LILRVLQHRLQIAAALNGYTLYLECHHPSARLTAAKLFCISLGTDGLDELAADVAGDQTKYVGQVKRMGELYSRFRPQRTEPAMGAPVKHPAGDVAGSRYSDSSSATAAASEVEEDEKVRETVTVDAHDLFSQLTTLAYLGKREPRRGLLFSIQEVSEGTIRVWRNWLAEQCESKTWTDGEPVVVHHDSFQAPSSTNSGKGKARADSITVTGDMTNDPSILWVNTRDDNVGIKFRVKEKKWRRTNTPLLYSSETEVAVSYEVEFEGRSLTIRCIVS